MAIRRRIACGESLAIRAILLEAGGGSTGTVAEELANLTGSDARIARALGGHHFRNPAEENQALRDVLDASLQREAALSARVTALDALVAESQAMISYLVSRHDDTYRQMMVRADTLVQAVNAVPAIQAVINAPPRIKVEIQEDLVLQGKYRLQVQENARLHAQICDLKKALEALTPPPPPPNSLGGLGGTDDEDAFEI